LHPAAFVRAAQLLTGLFCARAYTQAKAVAEKDKGNAFFAKGEFLNAVNAFTEAIKIDSDNHTYFSNRAAAYAKLEVRPSVSFLPPPIAWF
jgi:Flp pilus assembly protein TadD